MIDSLAAADAPTVKPFHTKIFPRKKNEHSQVPEQAGKTPALHALYVRSYWILPKESYVPSRAAIRAMTIVQWFLYPFI